ncbi:MAG: CoA transferase [Nitrososphaerales archaeon]
MVWVFDEIAKFNPKIAYCSASCFGAGVARPGYDTVAQGISGFMCLITDSDKPEL